MALLIDFQQEKPSGPAPVSILSNYVTKYTEENPKEIDDCFVVPVQRRSSGQHFADSVNARCSIPVIDLTRLNGDTAGLIADVGHACEEWGFFQVINHDIPLSSIHNLKERAKAFFALPLEQKLQVKRTFENPLGYNDAELTKNVRDWKEIFDVAAEGSLELPADFHGDDLHTRTSLNQWPSAVPHFREVIEEYLSAAKQLAFTLLHLIAQSLNLPENLFDDQFVGSKTVRFRLNHYPVCPAPELALGVGSHKDTSALTILLQDDVGGLEVKVKDGEWIPVKPDPIAAVINVGDVIQVYSNNKYQSVEHRVVVNKNVDRYSFPLHFCPAHWVMVSPVPHLVDEEHPPKYRPFNWGKYRKSRMDSNFKHLGVENLQISDFAIS